MQTLAGKKILLGISGGIAAYKCADLTRRLKERGAEVQVVMTKAIELAKWADLILLAPATADLIARMAAGMGNDLLTTLVLATDAPVAVSPAMNQQMYRNVATQENIATLSRRGLVKRLTLCATLPTTAQAKWVTRWHKPRCSWVRM